MNLKIIFLVLGLCILVPSLAFAMGQPVPQNSQPSPPGTSQPSPQGTPQPSPPVSAPITLTDPFGCSAPTPNSDPCFIQILKSIIGRLIDIAYPVLAGIVFYGGFQMMFAGGNAEKYKSGLKTIRYAVIGFAVILVSQGIGFILVDLVSLGRTP